MNTFKVGDILKGNAKSRYSITGANSITRVVSVTDHSTIFVEVIKPSYEEFNACIGVAFAVSSEYFSLNRPKLLENE